MTGPQILLLSLGLFAGMLVMMEIGIRIGRLWIRKQWNTGDASFAALEGAIFALMGLLIAFTFSAAASRYETRRQLLVEEINDIGTAWLRVDLFPPAHQPALRDAFRKYVDARIEVTRDVTDTEAFNRAVNRTTELQGVIWSASVKASAEMQAAVSNLVFGSLNTMIDITNTRMMAGEAHLPWLIRVLLFILPLICALLGGIGAAGAPKRSWVRMVGFALVLAITIYVIIDLDYPRVGLVRIDTFDHGFVDLRNSMGN